MRITVDASTWYNRRGFGRVTRELIGTMIRNHPEHDYQLLFDGTPPNEFESVSTKVSLRRHVADAAVAGDSRSFSDLLAFTRAAKRSSPDVLFFPAVYSWFPAPQGITNVLMLHDAIAEHYPQLIFPDRKGRLFWNLKVKAACWQATRICTVSDAAEQEIRKYIGVPNKPIDVLSEAPGKDFRPGTCIKDWH